MDATHINCPACGKIRPIHFEPLLPGEASLGTSVCCGHCGGHALTLLKPARFYCGICDDVRPGLLERIELDHSEAPGALPLGVLLVCAGCFDAKALLYPSATPSRLAGAAACDPLPRGLRADRARRG